MDILKCIPSVRLSDVSRIDLSEKQTTVTPSEPSPKGAVGRFPFLISFAFLPKHVLDLDVKFFLLEHHLH